MLRTFTFAFKKRSTILQPQWVLDRNNMPRIMVILKEVQNNRWQLKENKDVPKALVSYFPSYQEFLDFQNTLQTTLEQNKDLANIFSLDIQQLIEFLYNFSKMQQYITYINSSHVHIPTIHLQNITAILKFRQRSSQVLVQALRLAASQPSSQKEKTDLIDFLQTLDQSQPYSQTTLLRFCLAQLCKNSRIHSLHINEATAILQALGQMGMLRVISTSQGRFLTSVVEKCRDALRVRSDWKNLALLCSVFARGKQDLMLDCLKYISEGQFEGRANSKDLVSVIWALSQFFQKSLPEFSKAVEALVETHQLLKVILESDKLADQVLTLWSLQKISAENKSLQLLPLQQKLFEFIQPKVHQDSHPTNITQFYVASMRLGFLGLDQAKTLLNQILQYHKDSLMLGQCLYETLIAYPQLLAERNIDFQSFVRPDNIANILVICKKNGLMALYELAMGMVQDIPLPGLEIISGTLGSVDDQYQLRYDFDKKVIDVLLKVSGQPQLAMEKFSCKQHEVSSLLLKMESSIIQMEEKDNNINAQTLLLNLLNFYKRERSTAMGLGNLLYLASKRSICPQLREHGIWISSQLGGFDLLELLTLYKALSKLKCLTPELVRGVDEAMVSKLNHKGQMDSKQQRFISSFTRHHKQSFEQLTLVSQVICNIE